MSDNINHPPHYTQGRVECIDAIRSALGDRGAASFCLGNCLKYLWRCNHKGGTEDLHKAKWYLEKLIEISEPAAEPVVNESATKSEGE